MAGWTEKFLSTIRSSRLAPDALAWLGLAVYAVLAWLYTHTIVSNLDEGNYLYKGYLFVTGVYRPFGPGIYTGKAPLAFLIPGYIQLLFGPGLRTGRFFASLLGLLAVVGTWLTARRLAGKWLGAGSVWAFTLTPLTIKVYSSAVSEGTIACMLAWMFFLGLGADRRRWQLILSAVLAGLMVMTRQNVAPVFVLLLGYIFWQHGWREGLWCAGAGVAVVVVLHAPYWPEILSLWAPWLPAGLTPFLDAYRDLDQYGTDRLEFYWSLAAIDGLGRLVAFFQGIRFHFVAVAGAFTAVILAAAPSKWADRAALRSCAFLAAVYFSLFGLHAWASAGKSYCVFCFTPYLGFFEPAAILLIALSFSMWEKGPSRLRGLLASACVLGLAAGIGLAAFEEIGNATLNLPVPWPDRGGSLARFIPMSDILLSKTALHLSEARKYAASGGGLLVGAGIVLLAWLLWKRNGRRVSYAYALLAGVVLLGMIFSPALAGAARGLNCSTDVIALNEQAGAYLARMIPSGNRVYWDGGLSVVPLLYAPGVRIYPPQINSTYLLARGGDTDKLLQAGYWNEEIRQDWIDSSDYFIIEEDNYPNWKDLLTPDRFQEYSRSPDGTSCQEGSRLRVFKRIQP